MAANNGVAKGPDGIVSQWEFVTPAMAEAYLAKNIENNRKFMESVAVRYKLDMTSGGWIVTHEGIGFDKAGNMIDGQHRLKSISESGVSQWVLVTRGLPDKAVEVVNRGKNRTLAHALQVSGFAIHGYRDIAVTRAMMAGTVRHGGRGQPVTDTNVKEFMAKHLDAIQFANSTLTAKNGSAIVAAVVGRAYYHTSKEELVRFVRAMEDKIPLNEQRVGDKSARALAHFLATTGRGLASGDRTSLYRKTQNALHCYLNNVHLTKLHEKEDDLFPLPESK